MTHTQKLQKRIAKLETQVEIMEGELTYLNHSLMQIGFPRGISTLKATINDMLTEELSQ